MLGTTCTATRYSGRALSRKEIASQYDVNTDLFNTWLAQIRDKLVLGKRTVLMPKEISIIIEEFGDFRSE